MQNGEILAPSEVPSQQDIDRIASFVEAVRELKKEPFFHEDENRSVSIQGDKHTFRVGDRFHFRSVLVTFRRIWMNDEASNFFSCYNILWRFQPSLESLLLKDWRQKAVSILEGDAFVGLQHQQEGSKLTANELIDLWINAVFAHVSIKKDEDKRHQFDALIDSYGPAFMEYAFRQAVWQLCIMYRNVLDHGAEKFLVYWKERLGMQPFLRLARRSERR